MASSLNFLESRKPCPSFTGKLHVCRTLWICWSLEPPTYWPALVLSREEITTLQRIMASLLFCRSIQNRRMNYCLVRWRSQFTAAGGWQKAQADAQAPGKHGSVGRGRAGRSTSGQGSCLKTRTVLPSKHPGKHFLETKLKIIVLIFYVNG